nr:MAG TPA: ADP-ribosyltransferase exoenzyme [Caudoviricetes sp.]
MSKKLTSKQQKEQLNNLFAVYNKRLGRLYSDYVKKLTSLGYGEDALEDDALFNFDNFPQLKARLNDIFNDYYQNNLLCYKSGITDGVALAYNHDEMVIGGYSVLTDKAIRVARDTAAATFISNRLKTKNGLNLAQIIWNYCQQTKSEFEMAMSNTIADGIQKGSSAEEIGKSIRRYLNDPDMMYRRYHTIKVQKNGKKKDVVTWRRRRIIDGKVRFVEEPLEKVGMGVYRSARKNALRVARTEINSAYHKARNERWQNEPFVIGQYIHVSPQHNIDDICNDLEGRYPKDYVWISWHPQCICTSDPIMIEGEEKKEFYKRLMAGEDMSNYVSPFAVLTMPEKYNQYIKDNSEAIVKAGMRGKLAWHLQDNTKYWAHLLSPSDRKKLGLKAVSSKELILAKAKERHALRTKEQIDKIQSRWDKHRRDYYNGLVHNLLGSKSVTNIKSQDLFERYYAIRYAIKDKKSASEIASLFDRFKRGYQTKLAWTDRKVAMNVMKVAANYGETDVSAVQGALNVADYAKARQEAKKLAKAIKAIQIDEAELSKLIPDVNTWHKQFTSEQLHGVYDAVENKLSQWSGLTLEQKQKKLHFEAYDFLGGNMHGVQQKYSTWQVSQAAYFKELDAVNTAIEWAKINDALPDIYGYKTQSKIYHKLVYDLKNAVAANDKNLAEQLLNATKDKKQALIDLKLKKAANKANGSIPFDSDAYTQARKDAAVWAKDTKEADKVLRDVCGNVWRNATDAEKDAIFGYTSSYHNINEPLRGLTYYGSVYDAQLGLDRIPLMESIINKSSYNTDIWLQRGGGLIELKKYGLTNYNFASDAEIKALVGKTGTEGAFTSAGVAKGKGFGGEVITNIYAPRGTKMMYAEPYSSFGNGTGRSWDGISKQSSFGHESEIILQRGTTFRVIKVEKSGGTWYIDVEVINQDVLPFPYAGGYPYK